MRDADKLWRYTDTGWEADLRRMKVTKEWLYDKYSKRIEEPGFFYSETAKKIAIQLLEERRRQT